MNFYKFQKMVSHEYSVYATHYKKYGFYTYQIWF